MTAPTEVYCSPNCCPTGAPCRHGANRPLGRLLAEIPVTLRNRMPTLIDERVSRELTQAILETASMQSIIVEAMLAQKARDLLTRLAKNCTDCRQGIEDDHSALRRALAADPPRPATQ